MGQVTEVLAKFGQPLCLRARLIPTLKQEHLLSRDREGAVLFIRFSGICKYLLSIPITD
jgi:hypothetical protein